MKLLPLSLSDIRRPPQASDVITGPLCITNARKATALERKSHPFCDRNTLWVGLDKSNVSVRIWVASQSAVDAVWPKVIATTTHMKKKVSITLSADILAKVDQLAGSKHSRSAIIEVVLQNYLRQ